MTKPQSQTQGTSCALKRITWHAGRSRVAAHSSRVTSKSLGRALTLAHVDKYSKVTKCFACSCYLGVYLCDIPAHWASY